MSADRVSTGVDAIDRELAGGLRPGTMVGLTAPAASQSEAIINSLLRERQTLYISTVRTEPVIRDELDRGSYQLSDVSIEYTGVSTPIQKAMRSIEQVDGQINVVIDSINALERTEQRENYVSFLNSLKTHLVNTDSIALLHCTTENEPPMRDLTLTAADSVWRLDLRADGSVLENRLMVPKIRGDDRPEDVISVNLGREVTVDLSRDIA